MKIKLSCLLLTVVLAFAFTACGGGAGNDDDNTPFTIHGTLTPASGVGSVDTSAKTFSATVKMDTPIQKSVRSAGPSRAVSDAVVASYPIEGKLKDGSMILLLTGVYESQNKTFTLQASSSVIIFQMDGKLTAGNTINTSKTTQTVRVNTGGNNWQTVNCTLGSGGGEIAEAPTESPMTGLPASLRGKWVAHNPFTNTSNPGIYFLVSALSMDVGYMGELWADYILNVDPQAGYWDVIVQSTDTDYAGKFLKFRVTSDLTKFSGKSIETNIIAAAGGGVTLGQINTMLTGQKLIFIAPFADGTGSSAGSGGTNLLYGTYGNAAAASDIQWDNIDTYIMTR
jgi:hypothetical protein